jgi:hypothetical protein
VRVNLSRKLAPDAPQGEKGDQSGMDELDSMLDTSAQAEIDELNIMLLQPDATEPSRSSVALEGVIVEKTVGPVFVPPSAPVAPASKPVAKSTPVVPAAKPKSQMGIGDTVIVALDAIVRFVAWAWMLVAPMKRPTAPKYQRVTLTMIKRGFAATLVLVVVAVLALVAYQSTSSSPSGKGSGPAIVPPATQPKTHVQKAPATKRLPAILPGAAVGAAVVGSPALRPATGSTTVTAPSTSVQGKTGAATDAAPATAPQTSTANPPAGSGTTGTAPAPGPAPAPAPAPAAGGTAPSDGGQQSTPPSSQPTSEPSSSTSTGTGSGTSSSGSNDPHQGADGTCDAGYHPDGAGGCTADGSGGGE